MDKIKAVIVAGGKGSRISSLFNDFPKPLVPVGDKPILEHIINMLRSQGYVDIILTVAFKHEQIINYFGDGSKCGVNIEYFIEDVPLGNAGALFKIKEKLTDDFLLLNGDQLMNIDIDRFVKYHKEKGGLATILTHPNSHPYDSGIIFVDENKCVTKWLSKEDDRPTWYKNRVNAGFHILSKKALDLIEIKDKVDLDRDILKPLCSKKEVFAYDSPEYIKDLGTVDRYNQVLNDFNNGIYLEKSLKNKQKAIFLDRDGTINKYVGFLRKIDDFTLIEGVTEAIKLINNSGYLAIVTSNQPVIARGEVSLEELEEIHNKMETLLGLEGSYLDAIYFCPHHPDKGFAGEREEFKIECECRKPKPGMLLKAAEEFNIDLSSSWTIGDSDSDIKAGLAAGTKVIKIGDNEDNKNLLDVVKKILNN